MQSSYIGMFCVCVGYFLCLSGQELSQSQKTPDQPPLSVRFENGQLSASFRNQPLQVVCETIAAKSQINVVLADGLAEDLVSLNVSSAALDVALRDLLANYDTFVFYGGSKDAPSALRTLWVYPKGGASDVRPVSPSNWAGARELEAALGDTNAEIREAAYEALLERPDPRSRRLVLDALRGIRERDPVLRERLLSTAISRDFPFTTDVLTDLARTDPSEHIRWMALDTLAYSASPSVRDVAQAALTDTSESIRSRAKEMLNQISGSQHGPPTEPEVQPVNAK